MTMRLLFCFLLPPLAILLVGRPVLAMISVIFCVFGWVPGVILALIVVMQAHGDDRFKKGERAMDRRFDQLGTQMATRF